MGLLCCCFRPKVFKTERKRVLEERVGKEEPNQVATDGHLDPDSALYKLPTVGLSEQSLFDLTVHKMANKMINITALNNDFPQNFWKDRQNTYSKRVYGLRSPLPLRSRIGKRRWSETSSHRHSTLQDRCAKMETISREDLRLINNFSQKSSEAVDKGFRFWSEEPIVVQFNPNERPN